MTTVEKIKLLTDVRKAFNAISPLLDSPHNLDRFRPLHQACMEAAADLSIVSAKLELEIGTDNL